MDALKEILSHLELLGYEFKKLLPDDQNSKCYIGSHKIFDYLILSERLPNFICLINQMQCNKPMSTDMLKYINKLNQVLVISRASCEESSENKTTIQLHSFYTGDYSEEVFGLFFVFLQQDREMFESLENFEEIFVN